MHVSESIKQYVFFQINSITKRMWRRETKIKIQNEYFLAIVVSSFSIDCVRAIGATYAEWIVDLIKQYHLH